MATLGLYLLGLATGAVGAYIYAKCSHENELREIRDKVRKLKVSLNAEKKEDVTPQADAALQFFTLNELTEKEVEDITRSALDVLDKEVSSLTLAELCKIFMPIVGANYDRVSGAIQRVSDGRINLRSYPDTIEGYEIHPYMDSLNNTLTVLVETNPPASMNDRNYLVIPDSAIITKIIAMPPRITSIKVTNLKTGDSTIVS